MAGHRNAGIVCYPPSSEQNLVQSFCPWWLSPLADFSNTDSRPILSFHAGFHDKRYHDEPICLCLAAFSWRPGLGPDTPHTFCLLGVLLSICSLGASLGNVDGNPAQHHWHQNLSFQWKGYAPHPILDYRRLWDIFLLQTPYCRLFISENTFVFFDYPQSPVQFFADYLAMMGLWIFLSHNICKCFRRFTTPKGGKINQ